MNRIVLRRPFSTKSLAIDGVPVNIHKSLMVRNASPSGFSWGYYGSGCAQTALAILLHVTGDAERSERFHQRFKEEHVATWPQDDDVDVELDVREWVRGMDVMDVLARQAHVL